MRERRKAERVVPDPQHPVEVQLVGPGFLAVVRAINISANGVGVYLEGGLDSAHLGARAEVVLTMPHCRPAFLRGKLSRLDGYPGPCYVGVEFIRLPPGVQAQLEKYVEKHQHRPVSLPVPAID